MSEPSVVAAIDPVRFREVLGHYPTGVALVTGIAEDGEAIGMVVGTFTSVSLTPPLVAFLPTRTSYTFERLRTARGFTVNILAHDQEDLCRRLARPTANKFDGIPWSPSSNGAPIVDGAVASIDCEFRSVVEGGDHYIVLGEVTNLQLHRAVVPLLFFQGGYGGFVPRSLMVPYDKELASGVTLAQEVRRSTEILAERIGAEVTTYARVGNDVATVATVTGPELETTAVLGSRFPLMPPLGELFVAWEGDHEVEEWLGRAFGIDEETKDFYRARLETTKKRGWAMNLGGIQGEETMFEAMRIYNSTDLTPAKQRGVAQAILGASERYREVEMEDGQSYNVASIVAPVRNSTGQVQLVLRLSQLPEANPERLAEWANQLIEAAGEASMRVIARGSR